MHPLNFTRAILFLPLCGLVALAQNSDAPPKTYCNPLSLPDYPIGKRARGIVVGEVTSNSDWKLGHKEQYRELADPSAIYEDGKWYLYPSVDMAWESDDNGGTWQHHPLNIRDIGYAPTVVKHKGHYLLMAGNSAVYSADSPLGNYAKLGRIILPAGSKAPGESDPMLFSDSDERLFLYWGCTASRGIWGVELNADDPTKVVGDPVELIPFRPDLFPWEKRGEQNQNPKVGWMEGSWMLKRNGKYYLTYSAAGTENRTYAMGCYLGDQPLGPFKPQKNNPIMRHLDGLITGTGHGCVVAGPAGQLWAFFCVQAGIAHVWERRVGIDRAGINADGELVVYGPTEFPQWLPGKNPSANGPDNTGWRPLGTAVTTVSSSSEANHTADQAADDELRTYWQAQAGDSQPTLTQTFASPGLIDAVRIVWRDTGLDVKHGINPGPFRYRVEAETSPNTWKTVIDRTASDEDLLIDYRECPPVTAIAARLVITGWPKGIIPSVCELSVFGTLDGPLTKNSPAH
jgi:hypothetical protein